MFILVPHSKMLMPEIGMRITALLRDGVLRDCGNGTSRGTCSAASRTGEAWHAILANESANLIHVDCILFTVALDCAVGVTQKR